MSKSVKISHYDLAAKTHTVKAGVFPVEVYEQCDDWLYMARPFVNHPDIAAMEAYLIPKLGLQINRWRHHPQSSYTWYNYYIDIMKFDIAKTCRVSHDFFFDGLVIEDKAVQILGTDEFTTALEDDVLSLAEATYALTKMHELLNGLAKHKYRLPQYLRSQDITLAWKQS
jgi:uncharacterized protein